MAPPFRIVAQLRPRMEWVYTIEVPGVEGTYQTTVRAGPFHRLRAMRKMDRLARAVRSA